MKKIFLSTVLSLSLVSASFCPQISTGTNLDTIAGDYEITTTTVGTSDVMFQTTTTTGTYVSTPFVPSGTLYDFIENSTTATTTTTAESNETTTEKQPLIIDAKPNEDGYYDIEAGQGIGFSVSGFYDPKSDNYNWGKLCFTVEIADPSIACVNYSFSIGYYIWIDALSPGETVLTINAPDGKSVSANVIVTAPQSTTTAEYNYETTTTTECVTDTVTSGTTILTYFNEHGVLVNGLGNVFIDNGTYIVGTPTTTTTTESVTDTGTSGTTILTYFNEHGVLVDEFGNVFVNNGTSVVGTFNTRPTTTTAVTEVNSTTTRGTLYDFIENSTTATTTTESNETTTGKQPLTIDGKPNENGYYDIVAGQGIGMHISGYYDDPNSGYYDEGELCFTVEIADPSIACVNYSLSGECDIWIDALSPGETTVTITAPDGRSVSANIMVEEETLKIGSYGGYRYGEDFCEIPFEGSKLFCLWVTGCENPDPEKYCNGKTWFTFEIDDPSIAKINSIETDSIYHGNNFTIDALSIGETVLTVYAPDGRSASFKLIVVDPQQITGTTTIDPTVTTTTTTEIVTETGTSGTTILTYFNEHGVLVDEFGNVFVNNGTSVVGTFNTKSTTTSTVVSTADNTTTTSVDNTTTTTEMTSSNPDGELPQTGFSNIYKIIVGLASAMTITGTAMVAYSKKKDEE